MKKVLLTMVVLAVLGVVFYKAATTQLRQPEDAYLFSGTAETTSVRLSFKTSGRIDKIYYDEGDDIPLDAVVSTLDDVDERLAVTAAEAELAYRNAELSEVLAGSRKQEIRNAKAALDKAQAAVKSAAAELSQAQSDEERFRALFAENGVSKRTYELYKTAYEKAKHTYEEAKAAERQTEESLSLAIEGARNEAITKAKAVVSISEQALMQAKQKLEYTTLKSPISGTVLTKVAEEGEFIQTGSVILTVSDLSDMWIRGYVSEPYLGKIKLGQKVEIVSDSHPNKTYTGEITYISSEAEFTPKTVQTYDERINFMYRIKVTVDNSARELKQGMPVEGKIILAAK
ncbi:efflux RND transporter periplasmic adaptor subunit [Deferribacteres bacterium DY0037]